MEKFKDLKDKAHEIEDNTAFWLQVEYKDTADTAEILHYVLEHIFKLNVKYITQINFIENEHKIFMYLTNEVENLFGDTISYEDLILNNDNENILKLTIGHIGE